MADISNLNNRVIEVPLCLYHKEQEEFPDLIVVNAEDKEYQIKTEIQSLVTGSPTAADIQTAEKKELLFVRPDNEIITRVMEFDSDGSDGLLRYTVSGPDLSSPGIWRLYVKLTFDEAVVYTPSFFITVE